VIIGVTLLLSGGLWQEVSEQNNITPILYIRYFFKFLIIYTLSLVFIKAFIIKDSIMNAFGNYIFIYFITLQRPVASITS
jgi:hypothetical protein